MLSLFGHSNFADTRKLDQEALEAVIGNEERNKKRDDGDEWDALLDSQSEGEAEASASKGKGAGKRRQAGFAVDAGDMPKPHQPKKRAKAKTAPPLADSEPGEKTDKAERQSKASSASGKGKEHKELDNELQVIARQHMQTGGSSIESLQDLTVEWFLENCKSDERGYARSSKLRGVTCYNLGSSGVSGAIMTASFDHA